MSASRAPRSRLAAGSSSRRRSGIGHERARDRGPATFPRRQAAVRSVRDSLQPEAGEQLTSPPLVLVRVDVPPRLGGGVARGHDQGHGAEVHPEEALDGTPRGPDPPPVLPRVDPPVAFAEDLDGPRCRPQVESDRRKEGGLAGPVRTDHDPPFAGHDRPVQRTQDRPAGAPDLETLDLDHGQGHGAGGTGSAGVGVGVGDGVGLRGRLRGRGRTVGVGFGVGVGVGGGRLGGSDGTSDGDGLGVSVGIGVGQGSGAGPDPDGDGISNDGITPLGSGVGSG